MLQDIKFGIKLLWKDKAFTVTALLTLALCIGANTAIFSMLNAVVLAPLPYPDSERLVALYNVYPGVGVVDRGANSTPDYFDRRQMTDLFDSVALIGGWGYDVGSQGSPTRVDGQYVTPSYFQVLRAKPMMGRLFTEDDAVYKKDRFAILSYGLWSDMFGRDRQILGKDIRLSGEPYRIVGVMPEGFQPASGEARLWVPFSFEPRQTTDQARHSNNWSMVARLKPGVTLQQARVRIDALNRQNLERIPQIRKMIEDARFATRVLSLKDEMIRDVRPTLYLLQAAVAFVLLIGCVNVANLMLVRSNIRMKELAIRFSLGAGRWRLGRQLLTESIILAGLGGILGIATGFAGVRALAYLGAKDMPRGAHIEIDVAVMGFSALLAVLTGLAFGSVPVYHLVRRDLHEIFRQTGRTGTTERGAMWTRSALVVSQVALAFVLLIGAGLMALSFGRLLGVDPGFRPERVFAAAVSLPKARYPEDERIRQFAAGLLESAHALPGVAQVSLVTFLPFSGNSNASVVAIVGRALGPGEPPPAPAWNSVNAGYFQAMGIPLLQGRGFTEGDTEKAPRVVVIDEFFAHKHWPKGDAVGARIFRGVPGIPGGHHADECTVVGVVGSVKTGDLAEQNAVGQLYFAFPQYPNRNFHLAVKTRGDDAHLAAALRSAMLRSDPELPLVDVRTMPERLSGSMRERRAAMTMCLVFAGLALLLSAIGIYGVLAYTVTQRTREFGIRMALGAGAGKVVGMVLGQGMRLAVLGLAIGVAGAILLTRLMASLLFQVKPGDPLVFAAVASALMAVACLASLVPSLRVTRIRPANALRHE